MRSTALAVSTLALVVAAGLAAPAAGQSRLSLGQQGNIPAGTYSYVTSWSGRVVATDTRFAKDIANFWPGAAVAVDVVMQQCHGGGFGPELEKKAGARGEIPNLTFTSACTYEETANNDEGFGAFGFGALNHVDNFTRAWVDDARLNTGRLASPGFLQHARAAAFGRREAQNPLTGGLSVIAVTADPFGPFGALKKSAEHPQYFSPDPLVVTNPKRQWPNNARDLAFLPPRGDRYAILVSWDSPDERHGININRVYRTLIDQYAFSPDNIVVLHGRSGETRLPARTTIGPSNQDLGNNGVYVDADNTRENWIEALRGNLFTARKPGPRDRLFIYSTGHGGLHVEKGLTERFGDGACSIDLPAAGFDESPVEAPDADGFRTAPFADADGNVLVQVSTRRPISGSARVRLELGEAPGMLVPVDAADALSLDGLIQPFSTADLHHYQVRVPKSLFDPATPGTRLELLSHTFSPFDPRLVVAITVKAGEQRWSSTVDGAICRADYTLDGVVDPDDLGAFINDYFASPAILGPGKFSVQIDADTWSPVCDVNGDDVLDADDLGDFINLYFGGC